MDDQDIVIGSRIKHELHGYGTVTFIGTEYIGITFEKGGNALIRPEILVEENPDILEPVEPNQTNVSWPESTFVQESKDAEHCLASHWEPFVDDAKEILTNVPEFMAKSLDQIGYGGVGRKPPKSLPEDWPNGIQLVWPLRVQGLSLLIRFGEKEKTLASLFPFFVTGSQHTVTMRKVLVWESGVEAQIAASWGETAVTFFDTQYLINRAWYEAGKKYEFIFSGVAYHAGPAEKKEWTINRHPDEVAWMNQLLKEEGRQHEATFTMNLDGTALFLPANGGDVDDYSFHAPVKSVEEFKDWLGQDGWRVRATVMRFGGKDADLDILITQRAWSGDLPPQVGQDIEGRLWLQGYLWMPK